MRIFLIGFMGCGKTTLGKKLAKHLNYNFIDLDNYIEKTTNKTITEIFENKGEKKFRIVLPVIKSSNTMNFKTWLFKEPLYVADINAKKNEVVVGNRDALSIKRIYLKDLKIKVGVEFDLLEEILFCLSL